MSKWLTNEDGDGIRKLITFTETGSFITVGFDIKNDYPTQGYDIDLRLGTTEGGTQLKYRYVGFTFGSGAYETKLYLLSGLSFISGDTAWLSIGLDPGRPYHLRNFIVNYSGLGS